jgi:hypothetical protein
MHSEKNLLYDLLEMTIPLAVRPRIPPNQQLHESQLKFRPEQQQLQARFSRQQPNLHTRDGTASHARRYGLTRATVRPHTCDCICCFNFRISGIFTAAYSLCCTPYCSSSNTENTPSMSAQTRGLKLQTQLTSSLQNSPLLSPHVRKNARMMSMRCFALFVHLL